ncbi:unnamed protein product [Allacma fusca]|uniref:Peptidase C45 hydrolase domain-containing protein n=1 Tax=Allacma fusca TaxID=39272 RepID=A0A8J2L875_9HEXA|nr:unnamed protein product [Allacma fusca]
MCESVNTQQQIPVLYVRGTNYEIGHAIGKTFCNLISNFFELNEDFKNSVLSFYGTPVGKNIYDESLKVANQRFPHYVQEIQGMADGSGIPFHHLYLLHIENLVPASDSEPENPNKGDQGCTSLITNTREALLLGHTEDASVAMSNNFYIVSAEVLAEDGVTVIENFATLTYPGYLPGGTMGYNEHGIVHSVNSIYPKKRFPTRTSYLFLLRAILGAKNLREVEDILRDEGSGTHDGFSVNVISTKDSSTPGDVITACNIEVSASQNGSPHSDLYIEYVQMGNSYAHCNKYLRCPVEEESWPGASSVERHETLRNFTKPYNLPTVQKILSVELPNDGKCSKYSIFKRSFGPDDPYETIAVGIFDVFAKRWYLYRNPPDKSGPVAVLPMDF